MTHSHAPGAGINAPEKETPWHQQGHQGERTSDSREHTEFPTDKNGLPILDAAALEVLKAQRYFIEVIGDDPDTVVALLLAWALLKGAQP